MEWRNQKSLGSKLWFPPAFKTWKKFRRLKSKLGRLYEISYYTTLLLSSWCHSYNNTIRKCWQFLFNFPRQPGLGWGWLGWPAWCVWDDRPQMPHPGTIGGAFQTQTDTGGATITCDQHRVINKLECTMTWPGAWPEAAHQDGQCQPQCQPQSGRDTD